MKKKVLASLLAVVLLALSATPSMADRYRRATNDNPARIVGYVVYPIGLLAEYAIMRPIHWVVSRPTLDVVFGHKPHVNEDGTYFEWNHGDYTPSIKDEKDKMAPKPAAKPAPKPAEAKAQSTGAKKAAAPAAEKKAAEKK